MMTLRQIERLWDCKATTRLLRELLDGRAESTAGIDSQLDPKAASAAIAVIRLDELAQSQAPLAGKLIRSLLSTQQADGGWGDPMTTALVLRALLCSKGDGVAIAGGLTYLANLQKSDGIWPVEPIRRMPADPVASAFILMQLGEHAQFRAAVRFQDAVDWFQEHAQSLDRDARKLWDRASIRFQYACLPGAVTGGLFGDRERREPIHR